MPSKSEKENRSGYNAILRNNKDRRVVFWIFKYFALSVCAWVYAVDIFRTPALLALTIFLLCYYSFAAACITHNSMHCRTFHDSGLEGAWRHALSLAYGHPVSTFVPGHNLSHHRFTQLGKDPMRTSKMRYKNNFLNLIMFQPTVAFDVLKMDLRYLSLMRYERRNFFIASAREWVVVGSTQLLLILLSPKKFFLLVWVPHAFAQWAIVTMNMLQHDGCDIETEEPDPDKTATFNTCRNFVGDIINWTTFNNGFHTVHHMFPTLHWSQLKHKHEEYKHKIHPALNQDNMFLYIVHAFVFPGVRVDYHGKPVQFLSAQIEDEDWTQDHATGGRKLQDYDIDFSLLSVFHAACLLPAKLLSMSYSPVNKID